MENKSNPFLSSYADTSYIFNLFFFLNHVCAKFKIYYLTRA